MYKNIVFDFGGVMVDFDPHKYLIDLFGNRGLEEEVYDLTFGSREWRLLDAGRITRREANERMLQRARAVGRGFEVEGVLDDWMSMLDKYHLRADECIFIDDRADNLVAASALGFGIYEMHNVGTLLRSLPTFGVSLH